MPFTSLLVPAIGQIQPESRKQGITDKATQGPEKQSEKSGVDPWGMEVGEIDEEAQAGMAVWGKEHNPRSLGLWHSLALCLWEEK